MEMTSRILVVLAVALLAAGGTAGAQTEPATTSAQCSCPMAGGGMGAGQHRGPMAGPHGPMGGPGGPMMGDMSQASEAQLRAALQMHETCLSRLRAELQRRQGSPR
jgi:hypothetical protein